MQIQTKEQTKNNAQLSPEENLLSAVEDFWPQPSPNPSDYSDSDREERNEEEPLGFGMRSCMFKPLSTAGSAVKEPGFEPRTFLL